MGLLAAVCGCSMLRGQEPEPRPVAAFRIEDWTYRDKPGRKITTRHYYIYTTLRDDFLLQALPELVEASFLTYQELVPSNRAPEGRMEVYVFADRGEWVDFTHEFTGPRVKQFLPIRNGGYSERGVTVIQYAANQTTFPIMAHEGLHQYLYHYVSHNVPAWLNEGLAVMCEGQRWKGTRVEAFDPWYNPSRRNVLAEALLRDQIFRLSELLETHAGRIVVLSNQKVGTYYAQLWGLLLFLREGEGGKYAEDFGRLLRSLHDDQLQQYAQAAYVTSDAPQFNFGRSLFDSFISRDLDIVEREYIAFLRQRLLGER